MLSAPTPSIEETRANQAFDALLSALSRPGLMRRLPIAGEQTIIEALLDRECRVYCADPVLMSAVLATGAMVAELEQADHVIAGQMTSVDMLARLNPGSDLYPDDGATLVVRATLNEGQKLRLAGPGIETVQEISVAGLPDGFWQMRKDLIRYPMGFDIFLIDGDQVIGMPRSTQVEVL